jgi:hypothetical protein
MPTDTMFLLPYTPRADADARGYDEWIQSIDNPFFNSVDGISHYSNWKVRDVLVGSVPFTHFDFMFVDRERQAKIWSNEAVAAFANGWTEKWGVDPGNADLSVNYHVYKLAHREGPVVFDREHVLVVFEPASPRGADASSWSVEESVLGKCPCASVEILFGDAARARDLNGALAAFTGELIAAP